jgi:hypothetical protein
MKQLHSLGAIDSPFDNRDISSASVIPPEVLPTTWENQEIHTFPIWYQRSIGACVGHSLAKCAQNYWFKKTGQVINFSSRFLYAMAKCQDGFAGEGTYPRLVAKILTDYGCATEATCPNDTTLSHETYVYQRQIENIPSYVFDEAKKYKVGGFAFVPLTEYEIKKAIYHTGAVSVLVRVGEEWWTPSWNKIDIDPLRIPRKIVSGHQIVLTGWSPSLYKTVLNSWSVQWADKGFNRLIWQDYLPYINEAIVLTDIPQDIIDDAKNTKFIFTRDLHYGDKNEDVKQLQKRLGFTPTYQTSYYGDITREAVIKFQDDNHIPITWFQRHRKLSSVVGPKTREVLNKK